MNNDSVLRKVVNTFLKLIKHFWYIIRHNNFLINYYKYLCGKYALKRIIQDKKDNDIYLAAYHSLGDTLYALSVIKAIHEKYPDKKIVVAGNGRFEEIFSSINNIDKLILFKGKKLRQLHSILSFPSLVEESSKHGIINMHVSKYYEQYRRILNDRRAMNIYRKIFDLPENAPITYHLMKTIPVSSIENFDAIKSRTVIINPYSISMPCTMTIYESMCDELVRRGFKVFTNVVGSQQALKGSEPLRCSIQELYSIACNIPLVVSIRSGILDLMIPSGISMFVVYDHTSDFMKETYRLDGWESKCRIHEVIVDTDEDLTALPEKFSVFLDELTAEGRLS